MKLICFDMDHTLLRTNKVHLKAFYKALKKHGFPKPKGEDLRSLFGMVGEKIVETLYPGTGRKKARAVLADHNRFVVDETAKYVYTVRGVRGMLKKLKSGYRLALLSNASKKEICVLLKHAKISSDIFDVIIGSDEVRKPKPDPSSVNLAKKRTGCVDGYMVGDSIWDIQAGKRAGLKTVAVLTGNQGKAKLSRENPDFTLESVAELPGLLGNLK